MVLPQQSNNPPLNLYYGDLHNHCGLSYGHGSLTDALTNARMQLDFASVTIHAAWPDLPVDDPKLTYLIDYHQQGFAKALANWPDYLQTIEAANNEGTFVTFPSYEWHSIAYGDHCVYYKDANDSHILDAPDLPALRAAVKGLTTPALLIPHHIGYKQGSRGINWSAFSSELSPVAEIFSFHGLSESSEGPYPYLHSMGPRHECSTAQYGWSQGHVFGVIGSTDHHNAFPGSYGYGRLGVWADSLTRDGLWDAIRARRTYALTGDRIRLHFTLNNRLMGDICPPDTERRIRVDVTGGGALDTIDVLRNNEVIHRENVIPLRGAGGVYKLYIETGWGEQQDPVDWEVALSVQSGQLLSVEPRFRGFGPTDSPHADDFAFSRWARDGDDGVRFHTRTRPNASLHTATTEGLALEIAGDARTGLTLTVNGQVHHLSLGDLLTGSRTYYLGGFVSPAICLHRAVPAAEFTHSFELTDRRESTRRDWYYVRVRQRNDQWAWSSPIWVDGLNSTP
jgi:hypothetical protein